MINHCDNIVVSPKETVEVKVPGTDRRIKTQRTTAKSKATNAMLLTSNSRSKLDSFKPADGQLSIGNKVRIIENSVGTSGYKQAKDYLPNVRVLDRHRGLNA